MSEERAVGVAFAVKSPSGKYVGKGFYVNNPERLWMTDLNDARTYSTREL